MVSNFDYRIEALMRSQDNDKCFDCSNEKPMWASIMNGVFVCGNCIIEHKKLRKSISEIKSLSLDDFNEEHIKFLRIGGNQRLNLFLAHYGVSSQLDIETKYSLLCTEFYRCMLLLEVNDRSTEFIERPNQIVGLNIMKPEISASQPINFNTPQEPELPKKEGFFSKVSTFFDKTSRDIKEKIVDLKIDEKAKSGWEWTENVVIKTGSVINEKSKEVVVNNILFKSYTRNQNSLRE